MLIGWASDGCLRSDVMPVSRLQGAAVWAAAAAGAGAGAGAVVGAVGGGSGGLRKLPGRAGANSGYTESKMLMPTLTLI